MSKEKTPASWTPGQSGNPKGRPKMFEDMLRAREMLVTSAPHAIAALIKALSSKDEKTRINAADLILKRVLPTGVKVDIDLHKTEKIEVNYERLSLPEKRTLLELMRKAEADTVDVVVEADAKEAALAKAVAAYAAVDDDDDRERDE